MSDDKMPVGGDDFQNEVAGSTQPVVLDFGSPTCTNCKLVDPIVDAIATEFADRIKVYRINVEEDLGLARQYQVMSAPTVIVLNSGKVAKRIVGYHPKLRSELEESLALGHEAD